jgi:hypothetical protein
VVWSGSHAVEPPTEAKKRRWTEGTGRPALSRVALSESRPTGRYRGFGGGDYVVTSEGMGGPAGKRLDRTSPAVVPNTVGVDGLVVELSRARAGSLPMPTTGLRPRELEARIGSQDWAIVAVNKRQARGMR